MPLIAWVSVPPRPIQKVFWLSFSVTRSGSRAFSPSNSGCKHLDRCLHQPAVGKDAAMAGDAGVRVHRDQGVNGILGLDFSRPAALRAVAK